MSGVAPAVGHVLEDLERPAVAFLHPLHERIQPVPVLLLKVLAEINQVADGAELGKVRRVIEKVLPVQEVLLVVDATTGQNGLTQAQVFAESVPLTGLILTKIDGSARGGIALAIEQALDIPIKFMGTGELASDFAPFEPEIYIQGLL